MANRVEAVKDLDKWEPIVLTFHYVWAPCYKEPCCCPCCCCPCCYHPLSCCKPQKEKAIRIHNAIFDNYTKHGIFGKGTIAVSFHFEEAEDGFKATEIFRNIDAADEYYNHFMKDKMLMAWVLTNLPFRQNPGENAAVRDGNCKVYAANVARLAESKQTCKFNHIKNAVNPKGEIEVEALDPNITPQELAERHGYNSKFHFGWTDQPSMAETDLDGAAQVKPPQQEIKD
mmetsp:Transcript_95434/g.269676  ORF Transcript_95434/g.269676 Transcript_95434/m.269676 type:complete len:229 (-) Transcript_95434:105-791(-)|eukprot:CAMPEP_0168478974 /NCGR_PEP_ID=MMETSP0228-20121227/63232_1 /TAXON_ID=133427 /ORGANISM="Protoceratium reticulatum, Strain CCCM 535 (=CCMP 1889)" /LENGTH=228 /DNA_ID=CAMNT_0008495247 /DNA_START=11 /DNA_END=697 /DNA_ORIENTATION=+